MKKVISLLALIFTLALCLSGSVSAEFTCGCNGTGWRVVGGCVEACNGNYEDQNGYGPIKIHDVSESVVFPTTYYRGDGWYVPLEVWVYADGILDVSIPYATERCGIKESEELKKLHIGSVPEVLIEGCPELTDLTMENVTDVTIVGCEKLSEIILPEGVKRVEIRSVSIEKLVLPEGVEEVVLCCENLKSITLPGSVKKYNLRGCTSLTDVVLSDGVKSIPYCAFANCTNLQNVSVPDSVTSIGLRGESYAVGGGKYEYEFYVENKGPYKHYTEDSVTGEGEINYYYLEGSFYECTALKEINLPDSIIIIGYDSFSKSGLEKVPNLKNVTEMGYGVFRGCQNLEKIEIELNDEVVLGEYLFEDCQNLSEAKINSKKLGRYMFENCVNLKKVTLSEGVEDIPYSCFYNTGLEEINIPGTVKNIYRFALYPALSLTSISLPKSIEYIGEGALYSDSLKDIYYEGSRQEWSSVSKHLLAYKIGTNIHYNSDISIGDTTECTCGCHKTGLMGIIWKIILIIQRLFGLNPVCACGAAHY